MLDFLRTVTPDIPVAYVDDYSLTATRPRLRPLDVAVIGHCCRFASEADIKAALMLVK